MAPRGGAEARLGAARVPGPRPDRQPGARPAQAAGRSTAFQGRHSVRAPTGASAPTSPTTACRMRCRARTSGRLRWRRLPTRLEAPRRGRAGAADQLGLRRLRRGAAHDTSSLPCPSPERSPTRLPGSRSFQRSRRRRVAARLGCLHRVLDNGLHPFESRLPAGTHGAKRRTNMGVQTIDDLSERVSGEVITPERRRLRRGAQGLQRDDRPAAERRRALHVDRRRRRRGELRARERARPRGSRRRPQRSRLRHRATTASSSTCPACATVQVDPEKRTARAEGGATWGDFNDATHAHGLATTGGDHLDDRGRRAHARRRHRLPRARRSGSRATT